MKQFFFGFLLVASFAVLANANQDESKTLNEKIEAVDYTILELDTQFEMGMDPLDIEMDVAKIENKLLYFEHQLGTPTDDNTQWSESEQLILNAKIQLQALQEKLKLEGDWGRLRLRLQDFKSSDPGAIKLRYNYGF